MAAAGRRRKPDAPPIGRLIYNNPLRLLAGGRSATRIGSGMAAVGAQQKASAAFDKGFSLGALYMAATA